MKKSLEYLKKQINFNIRRQNICQLFNLYGRFFLDILPEKYNKITHFIRLFTNLIITIFIHICVECKFTSAFYNSWKFYFLNFLSPNIFCSFYNSIVPANIYMEDQTFYKFPARIAAKAILPLCNPLLEVHMDCIMSFLFSTHTLYI